MKYDFLRSSLIVVACILTLFAQNARAFDSQTFRAPEGRGAITLVSSNEAELTVEDGTTFLCKYTTKGETIRLILTVLGSQQVLHFQRARNGLVGDDGKIYLNPSAYAQALREREAERRRKEATRAAGQRQIAERQRAEAAAAAQAAEQARLAELQAQRKAEEQRLAASRAFEGSECGGEYYLPPGTELSVTVKPSQQCWTPWLIIGGPGINWRLSGKILVEVLRRDGKSVQAEDGPGIRFPGSGEMNPWERIRFQSLGKEPTTIKISIYKR
jgi:hypothetical protein